MAGHAVDAVVLRAVAFENEIHFVDDDVVGECRQLIENLPGLQAGFALEGLGEEQQVHPPRHLGKVSPQVV